MAGRTRVFVVDARYGAVIALVAALVLAVSVGSARADDSTTFTFDQVCAGFGSNSYVVPFGITKLQITVVGQAGKGGDTSEVLATHGGGVGGSGEKVVATGLGDAWPDALHRIDPRGVADYSLGGIPQFPNGEGNGGAGVAVSLDSGAACLGGAGPAHPLVVAGGGGGGGYDDYTGPGGTGGSAGSSAGGAGNPG